jgi:hypothetical protein
MKDETARMARWLSIPRGAVGKKIRGFGRDQFDADWFVTIWHTRGLRLYRSSYPVPPSHLVGIAIRVAIGLCITSQTVPT